jgi:hypothetical protein
VTGQVGYRRRMLFGEWRELASSLVRAVLVVVLGVRGEDASGMSLVPDQQVVERLAPEGSNHPFAVGQSRLTRASREPQWIMGDVVRACIRKAIMAGVLGVSPRAGTLHNRRTANRGTSALSVNCRPRSRKGPTMNYVVG